MYLFLMLIGVAAQNFVLPADGSSKIDQLLERSTFSQFGVPTVFKLICIDSLKQGLSAAGCPQPGNAHEGILLLADFGESNPGRSFRSTV